MQIRQPSHLLKNLTELSGSTRWYCLIICIVIFSFYAVFAHKMNIPGAADSLYYYHVAQSIVSGKGITTPYIWNYLWLPESLPAPAFSYWMPLTSFLCAGGLWLFGPQVWAALLPFALLVSALSGLGCLIVWRLTSMKSLAILTALFIALHRLTIRFGMTSDSALPLAVFGAGSLLMISDALSDKSVNVPGRKLFFAGLLAGLAALSRNDGVLVLATALLCWAAINLKRRGVTTVIRSSFLIVVGFALIMAPWCVRNLAEFDVTYPPPGTTRAILIEEYEDLYSYSSSSPTYSKLGLIQAKFDSAIENNLKSTREISYQVWKQYYPLLPFIAVAIPNAWRRRRLSLIILPSVYIIFCCGFYGVLADKVGYVAIERAMPVALPFGAGVAASGLATLGKRRYMVIIAILAAVYLGHEGIPVIKKGLDLQRSYEWIGTAAMNDLLGSSPIIMSRNPWLIWESTGLGTFQIPNDDVSTILAVARRYAVTHLHLSWINERASLSSLYAGEQQDDRFTLIATKGKHKLYRIDSSSE